MRYQPTALILGVTGNIGGELATRLLARGWRVRALHRRPHAQPDADARLEWHTGDALDAGAVRAAAEGSDWIVHGVNPPGYKNWAGLVLPMLDNSLAAARAVGARLLLPGTVYNYGPETFPLIGEDAPQQPFTRKGRLRVAMEQQLEAAADEGVKSLIVRAGDFFGAGRGNNWFSGAMMRPGKPLKSLFYPGRSGVGHQWAYLPDLAETMARLMERAGDLSDFARFHFDGHWDPDGSRLLDAIRAAAGPITVRAFPWWALPLVSPFSETLRELREMRYLWRQPARLDNRALLRVLGDEPHTPWNDAVAAALRQMGCLEVEPHNNAVV